ncbi:VCBS repeat-containing protein [Streptomyces sp. MST-110588]|uniref:C40 family peptidase n=1 Tax=Streptomyces sp. MST-110588 TaxID=2833628 RepID=UPI001F5CEBFA|nr:VCBS repeat-containing protein [Streptomyces sp. MST-110588]UNO41739.1 VCBS repeat-containing protein [Streptomyces sp. MST-110588]
MKIAGIAQRSAFTVLTVAAVTLGTVAATAPGAYAAPSAVPAHKLKHDNPSAGQGPSAAAAGARIAASPAIARAEVIKRAKSWVNKGLRYSMDGTTYEGYRTDCSGYVSMALGLPKKGLTTDGFVPSAAHWITKDELKPGDALNNPNPGKYGHVTLFEEWTDSTKSKYWGYEFSSSGVHHRVIDYPYYARYDARNYRPMRFNNIKDDGSGGYDIGTHDLTSADFNGDGKPDVVAAEQDTGRLWLYSGDGKGSIGGGGNRKMIGTGGWNGMHELTAGDFNGDGKADLIGVEESSGELFLYAGDGTGSIGGGSTRKRIGTNWDSMQNLVAGDFNEDGKTDIIATETESGELFFYAGDGAGNIGGESTRKRIGTNWDSMQSLTAGDFNGDGKTDVIGVEKGDEGKLFLYAGDGTGSIGGGGNRKQLGSNWTSMRELTGGDFNGDGKTDLIAVQNNDKTLWLYAGDNAGGVGAGGSRKNIGVNW